MKTARNVYLDYAATTPVLPEVLQAMLPYFSDIYGNPQSIHRWGDEARQAIEEARAGVAGLIGGRPEEVIFTSGGTESNNLAIKGIIKNYFYNKGKKLKPHIITSAIEHHCVLNSVKFLEKSDQADVTYLPVYKDGVVKVPGIRVMLIFDSGTK